MLMVYRVIICQKTAKGMMPYGPSSWQSPHYGEMDAWPMHGDFVGQ